MNFRSTGPLWILTLTLANALAQTPAARPSFEVASIRPSTTSTVQALTNGSFGVHIKGDRVAVGSLGVNGLIQLAYKVNGTQVEGPNWLTDASQTLFDIDAKLPAGATADQVPLMLQSLLADRFKLAVRKSSKLMDGYALIESKGGHKLQKMEAAAASVSAPQPDPAATPRVLIIGRARVAPRPDLSTHVETTSLAGLLDYLLVQLSPAQVVNKTGLEGNFDIKLDLAAIDRTDLPTGAARLPEIMDRTVQQWIVALDKVGLRLERQKISNDTIVIEHAEKAPTEN
jgi:uncharacterized protein (TIGR03435 family)